MLRLDMPHTITLCGSTRFKEEFFREQERLTLEGHVVISVGLFGWDKGRPEEVLGEDVKKMLDELHFKKIFMSNRIHVINKGGYIGSSTRKEIEFARSEGKIVTYMEEPGLIEKYHVRRTDGRDSGKGDKVGAKYFVLDYVHDPYARRALGAYADACSRKYPTLAADLKLVLEEYTH